MKVCKRSSLIISTSSWEMMWEISKEGILAGLGSGRFSEPLSGDEDPSDEEEGAVSLGPGEPVYEVGLPVDKL